MKIKYTYILLIVAITLLIVSGNAKSAIQGITGIAVKTTATLWTDIQDASNGDALTNGVMVNNPYLWNGASFDRARGTTANGMAVDVTRVTGTVTVSQATSGTAYYAVKLTNIAAASVNIPFGFTSKKVVIETYAGNTDEICLSYTGGTAVCPAANTAGNDRILGGRSITLDNFAVTSISVIAASGTQTIYVRAYN